LKLNISKTISEIRVTFSSPLDQNKRKDSFVRIGRASAFVRIGRGRETGNTPDLKRASSFIRIGKSSEEPSAGPAIEVDTTGNKRMSSSFVRIGRHSHAAPSDERWLPGQQN